MTTSNRLTGLIACALFAALGATPAVTFGQGARVTSDVDLAREAEILKPGQWVWAPQIAPDGPVTVFVHLSRQIATVYRNGVRIGVSTISSGKPGFATPTGVFTILQKDADHRSKKYNNAPMKFQERLTWDGVALHAGGLPGYPESHGCVHLPIEFARELFKVTALGGVVIVADRAGDPAALVASAGVLGPAADKTGVATHVPLAAYETYRWTPEVAPTGPLTIIASRRDNRVVVLRNGKEIGRARIEMPTGDTQTHVLTFTRDSNGRGGWVYVGVPGRSGEAGKPLDPALLAQARMPAPFLEGLRGAITPGATILVTDASVLPATTGSSLTVMTSDGPGTK
jgi:hypothetical protein